MQELCKQYFDGMFDFAVGERKNILKKPAPDAVNEVLQQLQTDRSQAVYIGDSDVDVETAKNAKMDGIFVDWGFRSRDFLLEHGAKTIGFSARRTCRENFRLMRFRIHKSKSDGRMAVSAVLLFYGSVYFILDVAIIILHKNQHSNL